MVHLEYIPWLSSSSDSYTADKCEYFSKFSSVFLSIFVSSARHCCYVLQNNNDRYTKLGWGCLFSWGLQKEEHSKMHSEVSYFGKIFAIFGWLGKPTDRIGSLRWIESWGGHNATADSDSHVGLVCINVHKINIFKCLYVDVMVAWCNPLLIVFINIHCIYLIYILTAEWFTHILFLILFFLSLFLSSLPNIILSSPVD